MQKEQTEIKNDKQAKPEIIEPTFDNWEKLINDIVENTKNEISPNSAYDGGGFTIFQIVNDGDIKMFAYPNELTQNQIDNIKNKQRLFLFTRNTFSDDYKAQNIEINTKQPDYRKRLNEIFKKTFVDKMQVCSRNIADRFEASVKKTEQNTIIFKSNCLSEPIEMKATDSFLINTENNAIIMCHLYDEAEGIQNTFCNIPVLLKRDSGHDTGHIQFNIDGSPKFLEIQEEALKEEALNKENEICGIKLSHNENNKDITSYDNGKELYDGHVSRFIYGPNNDIILISKDEFYFFAKEGQECDFEKIDHKYPIRYKKTADNTIQLTFTNDKGRTITAHFENGIHIEEQKKLKEIGNKLKEKCNIIINLEKNKQKMEENHKIKLNRIYTDNVQTMFVSYIVNNVIDGFDLDKKQPATFMLYKENDNIKSIQQMYVLDQKQFPLYQNRYKTIQYNIANDGQKYIQFFDDKNNITSLTIDEWKWKKSNEYKQNEEYKKDIERYKKKYKNYKITPSKFRIDEWRLSTEYQDIIKEEKYKEKYNALYKRSNFTIRQALKEGSYEDEKGKMTFNKQTGELKLFNTKSGKETVVNIYK